MNDKEFCIAIGQRIRQIRQEQGLSQRELAKRCGFETPNMNRLESGKTNPTITTVRRVAHALQISLSEMVKYM